MRLILLTALTMIAFAANSVLNRMALAGAEIGPAGFAALRMVAGALVLSALVLARGGGTRRALRLVWLADARRLVGVGSLTLYMIGFSFAYVSLDAGVGALILFGGVQITMFAGAIAAREPLPPRRWMGACVAFGGLVWLLWPGEAAVPLGGAVLMAAAAAGWGIYSLIGRRSADPLGETAANFVLATPLALAALMLAGEGLAGSPRGALLAVISGAVTSGLGYALWYTVLPRLATSAAAVAQLTVPVIAFAGGMVLLGEVLTARFVVATVLVLGGVALSLARRRGQS